MNDWGIHVQAKSGAYLVEDVFPAGVVVHNIAFDSGLALSVDCGAGFEFVSSQLLSASPQPVGCADPGQTPDQYRYQHLTRFRVTVPANTSGFISIRTFLDAPLVPGDVVTNCVQALAPSTEKSCAPVTVLAGGALVAVSSEVIGAPNIPLGAPTSSWLVPDPISDSGTTKLGPRDLAYSIRAINYQQSAGDVVDPVITQVLDNNVSFVPGSNWWRTWVTSAVDGGTPPAFDPKLEPSCASPIFEELPNAVGTQTMLRWTFRGCTLHGGWAGATALGVYVSVRMKPAVLPGVNVVSEARVSQFDTAKTPAPINPAWCDSRIIDAADLDGDGSNTDMLCGASPTGWKAPQGAEALSATALVQGALDSVPTRYPASGTTNLSGSAQYQFELKNSGVSPMRSLDMVDTLPASGDTTVSAPGEARTSEWDSELVAIDRLERGDASGVYSVIPSSEYQVGVTSSRNPCRWDSADGDQVKVAGGVFASISSVTKPAGCTPNAWAAGPVAGALSFAIRYTPSVSLEPGGTLRIALHTALNGAVPPPGVTPLVSWNSIAYTATLDGSAGPVELLTGEPLKVGVRFADPASTASVGGFVWKDLNSNGIRDDGPASPVQGTAVSVYDASNVVVTTIYTDASGYYQLSGLNPDESYRLTVSMSPGVGTVYGNFITAANMGPDPLVSSQAVQKGLVAEVSGKTGAANTVDRRNNFGLAVSRAAT